MIDEDNSFTYELFASDVENDEIVLSINIGENATFSIENNYLTIIPNEDYFGNDLITFSVTDDNGDVSEIDGVISISINPINDAPILDQVANGVAVRMAVLYLLAGGVEHEKAA